jgi:predicted nucleotidyltransferase
MTRDEVLQFLSSHKQEIMRNYGVVRLGVFGSYARGDQREDSDIDIAVEMETDHIFRKFFALEQYLKENLRGRVDLGIESALKPVARERILKEIVYV